MFSFFKKKKKKTISSSVSLEKNGLIFTGTSGNDTYMEIAEIPKNDFMVGVQFHPELNSTIFNPNPIIVEFIKAVNKYEN
jgi:CTP synthase